MAKDTSNLNIAATTKVRQKWVVLRYPTIHAQVLILLAPHTGTRRMNIEQYLSINQKIHSYQVL